MFEVNATQLCNSLQNKTSFEVVNQITTSPPIFYSLLILVGLPLLIYLIMGVVLGTKNKPAISTANFWILFMCFVIQILILIFGILFPVYFTWFGK